ncbi:MAG TPA: hypothetical protein VGP76_13255 [Planctomycetaceae bacterium]|jgi:hypothetical protein|nr:hypothetical protein [Planctomycetaceae bacterium]
MHSILTIDVDAQCSPELIDAAAKATAEAAAICEERGELNRDLAAFREKAQEDFVFGEADGFRDRTAALLVRELRLRQALSKIDSDYRRELAQLLDSRALPDLHAARGSIGKELVRIGFPPEAERGEADRLKILVGKLIDSHPRVAAAAGRIEQLRQTSQANDFAQQNSAELNALQARIRSHQEALARV